MRKVKLEVLALAANSEGRYEDLSIHLRSLKCIMPRTTASWCGGSGERAPQTAHISDTEDVGKSAGKGANPGKTRPWAHESLAGHATCPFWKFLEA
jgi:hypothetical protein